MAESPRDLVVVITHGTNTIEETAYFLNLVLKTDKPVLVDIEVDAYENCYPMIPAGGAQQPRKFFIIAAFGLSLFVALFTARQQMVQDLVTGTLMLRRVEVTWMSSDTFTYRRVPSAATSSGL